MIRQQSAKHVVGKVTLKKKRVLKTLAYKVLSLLKTRFIAGFLFLAYLFECLLVKLTTVLGLTNFF
ncbi:hypothetical protein GCM10008111_01560 [Alishewanella tabrizica]|uniref:Uncharacterized protein n=1 Tax=Alishewanella tabrizica TaxID=671278 RepID=A0ABQ2WC96_9ALTE|nr:hypothetical protein GCM10008111_01560 [Alishewanella tabrizica]